MEKRLFVGIGIENRQVLETNVAAIKKLFLEPTIKWTPTENMHVTLKFLGDTEESHIHSIELALESAAQFSSAFELKIKDFGVFPNAKMPRVVYAGVNKTDELKGLHQAIDQLLKTVGYKSEKQTYVPHVTVGRAKFVTNAKKLEQILISQAFETAPFTVEYFSLYESILTPKATVYNELQRFYLV